MVTALAFMIGFDTGRALLSSEWKLEWTGRRDFGQCTRVFAMEDRLVFFDSPPITTQDGGDVWVWRDREDRPQRVYSVQDKGVSMIRRIGSQLAIPGPLSMDSREFGNWYVSSDRAETWTKIQNLPRAQHVLDIAKWQGKLYAGVSDPQGSVLVSDNGGKTWGKAVGSAPANARGDVLSLIPLPEGLYASWAADWSLTKTIEDDRQDFYRFDGTTWQLIKLLPAGTNPVRNTRVFDSSAFLMTSPETYILSGGKAQPIPTTEGLEVFDVEQLDRYTLVWAARDLHTRISALYRSSFMPKTSEVGELKKFAELPAFTNGRTLAVHGGKIFVGCDTDQRAVILSLPFAKVQGLNLN